MSRRDRRKDGSKKSTTRQPGPDGNQGEGPRPDDDRPEPGSFAEAADAMSGLKRIEPKQVSPGPASPKRAGAAGGANSESGKARAASNSSAVRRASKAELRRLREGKITPETRIDLHNSNRREAHARLCQVVLRVAEAGQRCLLVIHGKGSHSPGGEAVIKRSLEDWIAEPPLRDRVVGAAPAQPRDGGAGATLLLIG